MKDYDPIKAELTRAGINGINGTSGVYRTEMPTARKYTKKDLLEALTKQRLAFIKMVESKKQIEYPVEGLSTNKPDDNFNLEANKYIRMTNRIYDDLLKELKEK
jgi:hypothetical protein